MKTIRDYNLYPGFTSHHVPLDAEIIYVGEGTRPGEYIMTIMGDESLVSVGRNFQIVSNSMMVPDDAKHVGSYRDYNGTVWHVFQQATGG